MNTTQHGRGWDLSIQKGILSVNLVNEEPKEDKTKKPAPSRKSAGKEEIFEYPTPADLTPKDLADNRVKPKKSPPKKKEPKPKVAKAAELEPPKDTTPLVAIKVASVDPLPLDGKWKHVFFTYDGSGKASGIKLY